MRIVATLAILLEASGANAIALTSQEELAHFKNAALAEISPYVSRYNSMMGAATTTWAYGTVSGAFSEVAGECTQGSNGYDYLVEGGSYALAQAVGAVLTGSPSQASTLAAAAESHVLDLIDTTFPATPSGGEQCTLDLSLAIPVWIETAELLEEINLGWSAIDKTNFRTWLASVYKHPAWASRVRRNNWGAAGSLSAWLIARYVDPGATLVEVSPGPATISPADAKAAHRAMQMDRIRTVWEGDSQCAIWGIQSHGGIPDELRRGSTGCTGDHILADDSSLSYHTMHVELLVYHARAIEREGSAALWTDSSNALLRSILFVISNPNGSWTWDPNRFGGLYAASRYYSNSALTTAASASTSFRGGRNMPWMRVFGLPGISSGQCP